MSVIAVFKLHGKLLSVQSSGKDRQNRTDHVVVHFLEESVALGWSVSAPRKGFCSLVDVFRLNYFLIFHLGVFLPFFFPQWWFWVRALVGRLVVFFFSVLCGALLVIYKPINWSFAVTFLTSAIVWDLCLQELLQSTGVSTSRVGSESSVCSLGFERIAAIFGIILWFPASSEAKSI